MREGNDVGIVSSGKIWPYAISIAILTFFGAIVFSITFILKTTPVEKSNTYMMGYHHADLKANDIIQAKIDFNRKYKIEYITESFSQVGSTLKYKVTDLNGVLINDATLELLMTRPDLKQYDQKLTEYSVDNGIYSFSGFTLTQPGRWNIMAMVTVGDVQRFYNVRVDTRKKEAIEY